ncbi:MAG: formyltransferase family protein [Dehalococcoidia bacterium]|nr:formyltransferase family protein [Dehalococcoidia bacterium]
MSQESRALARSGSPLRIGWLSTGRGPGSRRLLESTLAAIQHDELSASIEYVFCSRARGEADGSDAFLEIVEENGITPLTLSFRAFREAHAPSDPDWRRRYNADLLRLLSQPPVDVLVLAGLLLILDETIVTTFPTLNLHPAAPGGPVGTWQEVIRSQIQELASESGAMIQLATAAVDRGPIAAYCRFPIRGPGLDPLWSEYGAAPDFSSPDEIETTSLFEAIRAEGVFREVPLLISTLRAVANDDLRFDRGRVLDRAGQSSAGLNLTDEIEEALNLSR